VLAAIREVAGDAEVVLRSLQAHVSGSVAPSVWFGRLFVALGAIALLCSLLGVRAVTRLSLRVRQTQFGIHRAVGANRLALARVALGQPIRASLIGAAVGLYGSLFFLDTIAAAAGSALPPVKVLVGVAVLHVGAALAGTIPMTVRFVRSSPRTLISGTR